MSTHLRVEVHREGKVFEQEYSIGVPQYDVREIGTSDKTGTIVTFKPDDTIFLDTIYHYDILVARLRELAFLNKGVNLSITDKRRKDGDGEFVKEKFYSERGLKEFVEKSLNDYEILDLANKVEYEIDPNDEYPKNYTGTLTCITEEGELTEHQPCFRGGRKQPLTENDIDKKFNANLDYSKINESEKNNVKDFIKNIFTKPKFSKILTK